MDVLAGAKRERRDQVARVRRELAVDRRVPEGRERDDEGVELAAPVVHPVERGVRDQDVAAGAAEGEVAVAEARVVVLRVVVLAAVGEQVVVELQQVVAKAAEEPVAVRAADDPVVAVVAEQAVAAVVRLDELSAHVDELPGHRVAHIRVEVQEPVGDDRPRVDRVVGEELRVVRAGRVVVVVERVRIDDRVLDIELDLGLSAGDAVIAGAAVHEVVAEAAVEDVVPTGGRHRELRLLEELARDVEVGRGERPRLRDGVGLVLGEERVQRLGAAVSARQHDAVVAEDAVLAGAAVDAVVAGAAVDVVVLTLAEQHVVAGHAVDRVVTVLAVDQVGGADRAGCVGVPLGVVEEPVGARDDPLGRVVRVVVEGKERVSAAADDEVEDVAVVAEDHVGVVGMARAGEVAVVVAVEADAGAAEDDVAAVGPLRRGRQAVEVARAADQVVLAEIAEDRVGAAVALDPVAPVAPMPA